MKQKIALDIDILKDIIVNSQNDVEQYHFRFFELVNLIRKYHYTACNSLWKEQLESLFKNDIEHNLKDKFMQFLFRSDFMNYCDVNCSVDADKTYLYSLASYLPEKILISDNRDFQFNDINIYNQNHFLIDSQSSDSLLYRIPKTAYFRSKSLINDFKILNFYLSECTLLEIIDPYLLKDTCIPAFDFITSLLSLIHNKVKIRCLYYFDKESEKNYKSLIAKLTTCHKNIEILKPKHYFIENNHSRYLIINKDVFTIKFDASFNNLKKVSDGFMVSKGFTINIVNGRDYEDNI